MSEPEEDRTQPPEAVERRSRWPGLIWAVPLAVLAIVAYLAIKQLALQGPSVTVVFDTAGGIQASNTKVKYEGLDVGDVDSVTLQKDLRHVNVTLQLHSDMAGHLGPGTQFWIAGASPSLSDLSSIKSIITGPYIGVDPRNGPKQKRYIGLAQPPAVKETVPGTHYILHAGTIGSIARSTNVFYRDLDVGTVEQVHLEPGGQQFRIRIFVKSPFDKLVHQGTRFWNASAVQLSTTGSGPSVQFQSLPSLLSGAVDFETPDNGTTGPAAADGATFQLYDSKDTAEAAPDEHSVRYRVTFAASDAAVLSTGSPVDLAGKRIGSVQQFQLQYDPHSGALASLVTIALDPSRINLPSGMQWQQDARPQMNAMLQHLIDQGLRARIGKTVPVVGSNAVQLDFVSKATSASLGTGDLPEIPTAPGSDIQGLIASVSGVGAKLNAMPLDQIADNVHEATQRLAALSKSPEITQSLQHLDNTLANVDQVSRDARSQLPAILTRLRNVANEAQSTVRDANGLLHSNGTVQNQPETASIGSAMYELSRAARSLRELADYLDRHPEALLKGRG